MMISRITRWSLFLHFVVHFACLAQPAPADNSGAVVVSEELLQRVTPGQIPEQEFNIPDFGMVLNNIPWRYQSGDDASWASPTFDDSNWSFLEPFFDADSLRQGEWTGTGWFRLRLQIDSSLTVPALALSISHLGASEVYWDGQLQHGFGKVGNDYSSEQAYQPGYVPVYLPIKTGRTYVLAIRYSNFSRLHYSSIFRGFSLLPIATGMKIVLGNPFMTTDSLIRGATPVGISISAFIAVLLLMCLLQILLYFQDRETRSYVYNAALSFAFAFHLQIFLFSEIHEPSVLRIYYGNMAAYLGAVGGMMLLPIVFHSFLHNHVPIWLKRVFTAGCVFVALDYFLNEELIRSVVFLVFVLETLRILTVSLWNREKGSVVLSVAMIIVVFGFTVLSQQPLIKPSPFLVAIAVFSAFLTLPLALSITLSVRFGETNRELSRQLNTVRHLSEENLAKEREKQHLIEQQKDQLEKEVEERTAELRSSLAELKSAQQRLIQQEKMASLGQLTAGIAHEIKNPLNFINNFAALNAELTSEISDEIHPFPEAQEKISPIISDLNQNNALIAKHGKRADSIVRNMMQHASGAAGTRTLTDLNAMVSEYVDLAYHGKRATSPEFTAHIEQDFDDRIRRVTVVPEDLGRVLLNLIGNALDATQTKLERTPTFYVPRITVATSLTAEGVVIRIRDNGDGVPDSVKDKIFEPFFTTKPSGIGTGLGLSLSYDIITQGHGGSLTLDTPEEGGAEFSIILPAHFD